ncbi:hypothetical protein D1159_09350 [Pseudoflavonifractor sp. 524-17]|uniref:hypothetical protein n=1 Tax=Pseudoflavonifractor sp. 524-17 TaxID=2304577 RepID=UPI001379A51E|nr:hypothetical protein [Pseudoflavonifractor sp. 524-17]NCE64788.1 hypothetical protein [Pseudoflavonifractor sp. 524-17]
MRQGRRTGSWLYRLWCAGAGGLMGLFAALRLKAFLFQARGLAVPLGVLLCLIPLLALAGAALAPAVQKHLARYAFGGSRWTWAVYALCVLSSLRLRGLTLDWALEGGGVAVKPVMAWAAVTGGGILLGVFVLHAACALWECRRGAAGWLRGLTPRDGLTVLLLWLGINLLVFAYAKGSRTVYSWDAAIYWRSTYTLAETFRDQGPAAALASVYQSIFTSDYNYTIGLLCVPFALLSGPSRLVYLMSIGNFCLFPLLVLMWGYARSLRPRRVWLALAGMLALPSLFYTSVTGFVDVAGAGVALAALLLWLKEPGKGRFSRFLLVGLLAALAVVLRRWYAFYALAFLLCLAVDCAAFRRSPAPVLGYLCGFAFPLLFFLQTFVSKRLLANYGAMYAAYDLGVDIDLRLLARYYGIVLLLAACTIGIWLCLRPGDRAKGVFLLLEPLVCFWLFTRVQTHGQQHLLLYVPALACLLITGFDRLADRGKLGRGAAAAMVLPVVLSPALPRVQSGNILDYSPLSPFPTFSYAPPRQPGAMDLVALVRRLDQFGAQGKRVGLLSSSFRLNLSALVNAEDSLNLDRVSEVDRDYLINLPAVDQRDGFGSALYACDILAVADPIQLHLGEENQQVVWAPARCLLEGEAIAGAYRRLDETFPLEHDGITVYFFEKVRQPTHGEMSALADLIHQTHPDMVVPTWPETPGNGIGVS